MHENMDHLTYNKTRLDRVILNMGFTLLHVRVLVMRKEKKRRHNHILAKHKYPCLKILCYTFWKFECGLAWRDKN